MDFDNLDYFSLSLTSKFKCEKSVIPDTENFENDLSNPIFGTENWPFETDIGLNLNWRELPIILSICKSKLFCYLLKEACPWSKKVFLSLIIEVNPNSSSEVADLAKPDD